MIVGPTSVTSTGFNYLNQLTYDIQCGAGGETPELSLLQNNGVLIYLHLSETRRDNSKLINLTLTDICSIPAT